MEVVKAIEAQATADGGRPKQTCKIVDCGQL